MSKKITYEEVFNLVESKGCHLLTQNTDYNNFKDFDSKQIIKFETICKHDISETTYSNFKCKSTGYKCKKCSKSDQQTLDIFTIKQIENDGFKIIESCIKNDFNVVKTNEGCLADFIIKPISITTNNWLRIQLKSKHAPSHGIYSFNIGTTDYTNCIMAFVCVTTKKMWIMPYEKIKHLSSVSIGLETSKYNKYLVNDISIIKVLTEYYNTIPLYTKEDCLIPISLSCQLEHKYRLIREKQLNFIQFTNPELENMVYDFVIGNTTHQEKVISEDSRDTKYCFNLILERHYYTLNNVRQRRCYKFGECDFYWIWCKDTSIFYVIPEQIMFNNGKITLNDTKGNTQTCIFPHYTKQELEEKNIKSKWTFDYRFDLDNLDKDRLLEILDIDYSKTIAPLPQLEIPTQSTKTCIDCPAIISSNEYRCEDCNNLKPKSIPKEKNTCEDCDKEIRSGSTRCLECHLAQSTKVYTCIDCPNIISKDAERCKECSRINSRKVERPDLETLKKELETSNYSAMGRKYGVSGNAIRKWFPNTNTTEESKQESKEETIEEPTQEPKVVKQEPMKFTLNQSTVHKCKDCTNNIEGTSTRCETCLEILKLSFIKTEPTPVPKEEPEKVMLKKSIDITTTRTEEFNQREPKKVEVSSNNIFSSEWNLFDTAFNKRIRSKRK
jgi:hypothetical protein